MPNNVTLGDLGLTGPTDWAWPVTFRYRVLTPGYPAWQELTLDIPQLEGNAAATSVLAKLLWSLTLAAASTRSVECDICELLAWRASVLPAIVPLPAPRGNRFGTASGQRDTATLLLMSGKPGRYARKKLFLCGHPEDWTDAGKLNRHGWEEVLAVARTLFMGLQAVPPEPQSTWLMAFPRVVDLSGSNIHGVGFAPVNFIRVCDYVGKPPDATFAPWP